MQFQFMTFHKTPTIKILLKTDRFSGNELMILSWKGRNYILTSYHKQPNFHKRFRRLSTWRWTRRSISICFCHVPIKDCENIIEVKQKTVFHILSHFQAYFRSQGIWRIKNFKDVILN